MKQNSSPPLSILQLLAYWRAFAQLLTLYARCAARKQYACAPDAWATACQLEVCARAALAELLPQARRLYRETPPQTEEEADAYEWLSVVAGMLMALAFFAQMLKHRLAGRGASDVLSPVFERVYLHTSCAPACTLPYLDSG